jgi:hypothetical protein
LDHARPTFQTTQPKFITGSRAVRRLHRRVTMIPNLTVPHPFRAFLRKGWEITNITLRAPRTA